MSKIKIIIIYSINMSIGFILLFQYHQLTIKQSGIMPLDVQCNAEKKLIFDNEKISTCVSYNTAKKLILRDGGTFYRHF